MLPRNPTSLLLLLLVALSSCSIAPCAATGADGNGAPVRDGDPGSRAHYKSSSWDSTALPPTSEEERVDKVLGDRKHLTPSELASAAPSILPPGMIHKGLKDDEVYRILRNFVTVDNSSSLPQKPSPAEVKATLAKAAAENWLTRAVLLSLASNTSKDFMALADVSQGGVVNKEHEYNAWSARDDPFFDLESWSGGNSSSPQIPASIDRAFDKADWTADQRRGINASAAESLGFGDRVSELFLAMDQGGGDGELTLEELSDRMPADTPLLDSSSSSSPSSSSSSSPSSSSSSSSSSPSKRRRPIYAYTPENGKFLAKALLRAFDADSDGRISRSEAAGAVEALSALRAGEGPGARSGRQLIAALVLGDKYSTSAALTDKEVAAYAARARQTGEMAVSPPSEKGDPAVARWFDKANGGKKSSSVEQFVALADEKKKSKR